VRRRCAGVERPQGGRLGEQGRRAGQVQLGHAAVHGAGDDVGAGRVEVALVRRGREGHRVESQSVEHPRRLRRVGGRQVGARDGLTVGRAHVVGHQEPPAREPGHQPRLAGHPRPVRRRDRHERQAQDLGVRAAGHVEEVDGQARHHRGLGAPGIDDLDAAGQPAGVEEGLALRQAGRGHRQQVRLLHRVQRRVQIAQAGRRQQRRPRRRRDRQRGDQGRGDHGGAVHRVEEAQVVAGQVGHRHVLPQRRGRPGGPRLEDGHRAGAVELGPGAGVGLAAGPQQDDRQDGDEAGAHS
jgi:hypothetical protein